MEGLIPHEVGDELDPIPSKRATIMSIELMRPTGTTTRRIRKQVAYIIGSRHLMPSWSQHVDLNSLWLAAPHPVFNLPFHSITARSNFEQAYMTGWRYFLVTATQALAAAEMRSTAPDAPGTFAQLVPGPRIQSSFSLLARVEQLDTVKAQSFALGLLRVPALQFQALWLRNMHSRADEDLFVPIDDTPTTQVGDPLRRRGELMARLVLLKARLRTADPSVTPGG